jgi:hypothetical protein
VRIRFASSASAALLAAACAGASPGGNPSEPAEHSHTETDVAGTTSDTGLPDTGTIDTGPADADGDGFPAGEDCDDLDPGAHPGGYETCNWRDDDCDGLYDDACHAAITSVLDLALADQVFEVGPPDYANYADVGIGDADGDGRADLLLADLANGHNTGTANCSEPAVYLVRVPPTPTPWAGGPSVLATLRPPGSELCLGFGPHLDGDGDGDGFDDLVAGDNDHQAFVFRGPLSGDYEFGDADMTTYSDEWSGVGPARWVGNLDGLPGDELAMGVPAMLQPGADDASGVIGRVLVFAGYATGAQSQDDALAVIDGRGWDSSIGRFVGTVGDIDGDGFEDLAVDGQYIFLGPVVGWQDTSAALVQLEGGEVRDHHQEMPAAVCAGDIDGDGLDDVAISAGWTDDRGVRQDSVALLSYSDREATLAEDLPRRVQANYLGGGDSAGGVVAADFDGDGRADVALGYAPDTSTDPYPAVSIEYGPFEGVRELGGGGALAAPSTVGVVGLPLAIAAADVNGDGYDDVVLGSHNQSETDPLLAWLVLGGPR